MYMLFTLINNQWMSTLSIQVLQLFHGLTNNIRTILIIFIKLCASSFFPACLWILRCPNCCTLWVPFFALFSFLWRFRHLRTLTSPKAPWARWCTFKKSRFCSAKPDNLSGELEVFTCMLWKILIVTKWSWAVIKSSTMTLMRARWPISWLAKILLLTDSAFFFQAGPLDYFSHLWS